MRLSGTQPKRIASREAAGSAGSAHHISQIKEAQTMATIQRYLDWHTEQSPRGESFLATKNRHPELPNQPAFILLYRSEDDRSQGCLEEVGWHALEGGWESDDWTFCGTLDKAMAHCTAVHQAVYEKWLIATYPED
jgi:hypothetical protein